jgi:cell wall-associated NlpC family hydrolase
MDEDEDDEWGEMVSSPVVPQHPTNVLSFQQPIAATVSAVSAPQVTDDPWGAADFSVFDSGPAKSASHPPASPAAAKTEETSASASKPAPAANYPAPTTKTTKIISNTSPTPTVGPSALTFHNAQDAHEEAAQRILTNLPDLSYMLR